MIGAGLRCPAASPPGVAELPRAVPAGAGPPVVQWSSSSGQKPRGQGRVGSGGGKGGGGDGGGPGGGDGGGGGGGGGDPLGSALGAIMSEEEDSEGDGSGLLKGIIKLLANRTREQDKLSLPEFPNATGFRAWKNTVRHAVSTASGKGEKGYRWITEVEAEGQSFDALAHSGRTFGSLDQKLAAALVAIAKGELGRQITHASETERREGRCVKGRQLLFLVYQYYRIDEAAGALYNIHDLWNVTFVNDDKMEGFLASWDALLAGMKKTPSDEDLEVIFLRQMRKSKALTIDVAQYDRADPGNPDRSYEFLIRAARRFVEKKILESNRHAIAQAASGTKPVVPAPKGGKGGKGKGRSQSRSGGRCYEFSRSGTCSRGDACGYKHERGEKRDRSSSRGRGKGKGKGKSRSGSPGHQPGRRQGQQALLLFPERLLQVWEQVPIPAPPDGSRSRPEHWWPGCGGQA